MRKYNYLVLLGFLSLSLTLFYACQKDSNNVLTPVQSLVAPPITTSSSSVDPLEEENCDKMVHTAALGILNLSKDPQFRDLVHQHCLAMFDDDYNVLLKDLKTPLLTQTGIDLANSFDNSIRANLPTINSSVAHVPYGHFTDFDNIRKSIDGFDYYSGREYLQIYVPNFESATSELPNTVANEQPILLIYPEEVDDTTPAYGYVLQDDGTFKVTMITQNFLDSHLIWVISINETVDDDGNCPVQSKSVVKTGGSNNLLKADSRGNTEKKKENLLEINISGKKESGWSGRADVAISFGHFQECLNSDKLSTYGPLFQISNSDINARRGELKKVGRYKLNSWLSDVNRKK